MSLFTILQIVFAIVSSLLLLAGVLLTLGLAQFNKRVPKTHPINRKAGAGLALLGIGMLSLFAPNWSDSTSTASTLGWGLVILGLVSVTIGRRVLQRAIKQANTYDSH